MGNAIKFTERGGVRAVARLNADCEELMVDNVDSGVGIPANVCETIFKPFIQADSFATRRFGGTGLGLSIGRHITAGLCGRVTVLSEVGRGRRSPPSWPHPDDFFRVAYLVAPLTHWRSS